jgi:hypothetical protein
MNLLSLTYQEFERLLKAFTIVTVLLTVLVALIRWLGLGTPIATAAWQGFTLALSTSTLAFGFFARWTWKSPRFAKWLKRPIVHGLWRGTLRTNFRIPDGRALPEIEIAFVIRQTYLTLSIESYTKGQEGESKVEALIRNAKTETTRISYIFELRRQYQGENKLTTGAGELKLLDEGRRLKGHYWTNSPTQGDLELSLVTRDCEKADCFEAAERIWLSKAIEQQAPPYSAGT